MLNMRVLCQSCHFGSEDFNLSFVKVTRERGEEKKERNAHERCKKLEKMPWAFLLSSIVTIYSTELINLWRFLHLIGGETRVTRLIFIL